MATKSNSPGYGIEYEILIPAFFALELNNNPDVIDFTIEINRENFGNIDDVVIHMKMYNDAEYYIAIQLKHKEKEDKKIIPSNFEAKGNFSLDMYCTEWKKLYIEHKKTGSDSTFNKYYFILYTNQKFFYDTNSQKDTKKFIIHKNYPLIPHRIFNTSATNSENMYKFEIKKENLKTEDLNKNEQNKVTIKDFQEFFSRFSLYTCQKNFLQLREEMMKILKYESVLLQYIEFFRKCHQKAFTNKIIDKQTVNLFIIDMFLSQFLINKCNLPLEERIRLEFEAAVREFDITVINGLNLNTNSDPMSNLTYQQRKSYVKMKVNDQFYVHFEVVLKGVEQLLLSIGKQWKIVDKSVTTLDLNKKTKILCYLYEDPMYIQINQLRKNIKGNVQTPENYINDLMELYKPKENKIKFVFLNQEIDNSKIWKYKIFRNLNDLVQRNKNVYFNLEKKFQLFLQGRKISSKNLLILLNNIKEIIKVKDILEMLSREFNIGEEMEKLPECYIPRTISRKLLSLDSIVERFNSKFNENEVFVFTNCNERFLYILQNRNFQAIIIGIEEYSEYIEELKKHKLESKNILVFSEKCPKEKFIKIKQEYPHKKVHLFQDTIDGNVVLIKSTEKNFENDFVQEEKIHHYFNSSVNILSAHPGSGKSTMLQYLKNIYPTQYWTILIELKRHNNFFKNEHSCEEALKYFLNLTEEDTLLNNLKEYFLKKKKIAIFLDAIDEIDTICVHNVLNFIKKLEGYRIWVSSRSHLQNKLEDYLNIFSIEIEDFTRQQQEKYIRTRLTNHYTEKEIEVVIKKTFEGLDIVSNSQILGIPQQLFVITELFLNNRKSYDVLSNMSAITEIYMHLFTGMCENYVNNKLNCPNPHLLQGEPEDYLLNYEIPALQSYLEESVLRKLKLDLRKSNNFLNHIMKNGDRIGIILEVFNDNKAKFGHSSYAEFFVCRFLTNNFEKARLMKEHLFSEEYQSLMMMLNIMLAEKNPLHLAVIYKDIEHIKKFIDDPNVRDQGGRNPLHLACCNMTRYSPTLVNLFDFFNGLDEKETESNRAIVEKLQEFDPFQSDELFKLTPIDYSFAINSFFPIEIILRKAENRQCFTNFPRDDFKHVTIACFSALLTYPILLSVVLNEGGVTLAKKIYDEHDIFYHVVRCQKISQTGKELGENEKKIIELLLDNCVDMEAFLKNTGTPPIHFAVNYNHDHAVKLLFEKGADVNQIDKENNTILHCAIENNADITLIEYMLQRGVDVNIQNGFKNTPLHCAVDKKRLEVAGLLLKKGAKINTPGESGYTPLFRAVQTENLSMVKLLLEENRDENVATELGTPLHKAATLGRLQIFELLLNNGGDINVKCYGNTILHSAVFGGNINIIKLIVDKGFPVNVTNDKGDTLLQYAIKNRANQEVVRYLGRWGRRK